MIKLMATLDYDLLVHLDAEILKSRGSGEKTNGYGGFDEFE